jgi:hypothetical protein
MASLKYRADFVFSRIEDAYRMSHSGAEKLTVESELVERYHPTASTYDAACRSAAVPAMR